MGGMDSRIGGVGGSNTGIECAIEPAGASCKSDGDRSPLG
jgi:hypothetical protein